MVPLLLWDPSKPPDPKVAVGRYGAYRTMSRQGVSCNTSPLLPSPVAVRHAGRKRCAYNRCLLAPGTPADWWKDRWGGTPLFGGAHLAIHHRPLNTPVKLYRQMRL